ncbi:WD40 repeat-like protein [Rhizoctonia solani]|uniref:WD40 repeat-like protein n=1 Tax=Rhizoctonia solani TaxID=456999 RepID=A0A8H7IDE4_9AGAM|nr:WD40 repeat-like protein [Rhizoctonia solani]
MRYLWAAETGTVTHLSTAPCDPTTEQPITHVTGLDWSLDAAYLGISYANGTIEVWDVESGSKLRSMMGQGQVACLAWNQHILGSGCVDGAIWMHDTRIAAHKVAEMIGHTSEVCGLKWQPANANGSGGGMLGMLASGGNDNVVNAWDSRVGSGSTSNGPGLNPNGPSAIIRQPVSYRWRHRRCHDSLLVFNLWGTSELALNSGPGHFACVEPAFKGAVVHAWVPAQRSDGAFVSRYGQDCGDKDAHDTRVLFSAASPNGDVVATGAGDENLKFWKIWEIPKKTAVRKREERAVAPLLARLSALYFFELCFGEGLVFIQHSKWQGAMWREQKKIRLSQQLALTGPDMTSLNIAKGTIVDIL